MTRPGNGSRHSGVREMALVRFADIIGQENAKRILSLAFSRHKTSHAYLFQGPTGVGKKLTARAFATFLLCQAEDDRDDSCGQCPSCRKMASGNHPDFLEIQPDGAQIKIDQIRELKKALSYSPVEDGYRVVVLADIHQTMARAEVANSLLKTLEEPPARTVFILTAVEAAGILPTIVSRCQVVPFYPLPYEQVSAALTNEGLPGDKAYVMASIAEGSIGRARDLAKTDLLEIRKKIAEDLTGLTPGQAGAVERLFGLAEQAALLKDELGDLLELLKLWLKDLMILGAGGPVEAVVNHDLRHILPAAGQRWNAAQLVERVAMIQQAQKQLRHNCNRAFVCEVLLWAFIQ
jgi:DNA polymerase-3 subunit delta'